MDYSTRLLSELTEVRFLPRTSHRGSSVEEQQVSALRVGSSNLSRGIGGGEDFEALAPMSASRARSSRRDSNTQPPHLPTASTCVLVIRRRLGGAEPVQLREPDYQADGGIRTLDQRCIKTAALPLSYACEIRGPRRGSPLRSTPAFSCAGEFLASRFHRADGKRSRSPSPARPPSHPRRPSVRRATRGRLVRIPPALEPP